MSILAKHFSFVNEHIAVQEKLARKFAPTSRIFNEYRYTQHQSNTERFRALLADLEASDKALDQAPSPQEVQASALLLDPVDLEGLPPELLEELSDGAVPDRSESLVRTILQQRGGVATLDQVLIGVYKATGEILKRNTLTSKLYRMAQKGQVFTIPNKKGVYSLRRLSDEECAKLFGDGDQLSLA
jgi:hypothetical protein